MPCRTDRLGHTVPVQPTLGDTAASQPPRNQGTSDPGPCLCCPLTTLEMAGSISKFWGTGQPGNAAQPTLWMNWTGGHLYLVQESLPITSHPRRVQLEGALGVNSATVHIPIHLGLM